MAIWIDLEMEVTMLDLVGGWVEVCVWSYNSRKSGTFIDEQVELETTSCDTLIVHRSFPHKDQWWQKAIKGFNPEINSNHIKHHRRSHITLFSHSIYYYSTVVLARIQGDFVLPFIYLPFHIFICARSWINYTHWVLGIQAVRASGSCSNIVESESRTVDTTKAVVILSQHVERVSSWGSNNKSLLEFLENLGNEC